MQHCFADNMVDRKLYVIVIVIAPIDILTLQKILKTSPKRWYLNPFLYQSTEALKNVGKIHVDFTGIVNKAWFLFKEFL